MTVTRSVTAMISRSLWVTRITVLPCSRSRAEHAKELVGLLRREHRGRLVEDQDLRAAVERLQDLHPLLHADRQMLHHGVERHGQAVVPGDALQLGAGAGESARQPPAALDAEHDVLQHGEVVHEHEVLVHHADARGDRVVRAVDVARRPWTRISPASARWKP